MRAARQLLLPLLLLSALACATVRVSSDHDPTANFAAYRSYAWIPDPPARTGHPRLDSELVQDRVRRGIDRTLAAKGFARDDESPDFLVTYHLAVDRKLDVYTMDHVYYGYYGYRVLVPETIVDEYDEGSLIIDVVDAREEKVVWRGVGSRRLQDATGPQDPVKLEERTFKAVDEVLESFPPPTR
jgi:hypothetical protein